jgi:hypothetical protein
LEQRRFGAHAVGGFRVDDELERGGRRVRSAQLSRPAGLSPLLYFGARGGRNTANSSGLFGANFSGAVRPSGSVGRRNVWRTVTGSARM